MSENEPTKLCVKVLKCESVLRYIIAYPFVKSLKLITKLLIWVGTLIVTLLYGCVVRATVRWVGIVTDILLVYYFYYLLVIPEPIPSKVFIMIVAAVIIVSFITIYTWTNMPSKEVSIVTQYTRRL